MFHLIIPVMFLVLNNEIASYKQILNFHNESGPDIQKFNEIHARGYYSDKKTNYVKCGHITLIFYGILRNFSKLCNSIHIRECSEISPEFFEHPSEIIIPLYQNFGFEYTMQLLEGEFSLFLFDNNLNQPDSKLYVAVDRLGLCPFYMLAEESTADRKILGFSNTIAKFQTTEEDNIYTTKYNIRAFTPGTYSEFSFPYKVLSYWKPIYENRHYFVKWPKILLNTQSKFIRKTAFISEVHGIQEALKESIQISVDEILSFNETRTTKSEFTNNAIGLDLDEIETKETLPTMVPDRGPIKICCLLSGGFDSSLITALITDYIHKKSLPNMQMPEIHTFSMGFHKSSDLKNAKTVAEYLSIDHTELVIGEFDYVKYIPTVIELLETSDIAVIRYGVALYLLLKNIHDHTNIRDIFTGDGADELMGSYLNFYYIKNILENDSEIHKLLDRYPQRGGLYWKLFDHFHMRWWRPFLDHSFVDKYMSIPMEFRFEIESIHDDPTPFDFDKALLRMAFSREYYRNYRYMDILPKSIMMRTTEPGYDSISSFHRPLCQILSDHLKNLQSSVKDIDKKDIHEPIYEISYYDEIYQKMFQHVEIPEMEYPYKYAKTKKEPTMRKLDVYLEFHMEYQDRTL